MRIAFVAPYEEYALGIRSISSFLKARGHEVYRIFLKTNLELNQWHEIAAAEGAEDIGSHGFFAHPCRITTREMDLITEKLAELRVKIVGIPLTSNVVNVGEFLTRRIQEDLGLPVIWGGIDPTLHPDKAIAIADFVCVGEGEFAMADFLDALEDGQRTPKIDGIWTRHPDGTVYRGPIRPLIQDLDALPYCDWDPAGEFHVLADQMGTGFFPRDWSWVNVEVPLMTQRGCPFSCTYCAYSVVKNLYRQQKFVRRRSVENVVGELAQLRQRFPGLKSFFFYDDVFTLHPSWIEQFAEHYAREIAVPFGIFTYPGYCSRRTLEPLKRAGLIDVRIGVQSGSDRVLRQCYNRRTSSAEMLESARLIKDLGLGLTIDLIAYNPLESEDDQRATVEFLLQLPRPFRISAVNPLCFYDGLPITEMAQREGVKLSRPRGGGNKLEQVVTPQMRFWAALMGLTMFDLDPDEILRPLMDDPYLREHPEVLETLRLTLYSMNFVDGQTAEMSKDRCLKAIQAQLAWWQERARRPLLRKILDRLLRR
ncbi:hypothetical protein AMJ85_02280 [candidate division BRC1 bacterium SM23_51]|nr:MAG: hypothetical protein AMJ85_02280 [candidate division BRC1 bacterium SM23_51]